MAIRGPPAKGLVRGLPEARVRISLSPPNKRLPYRRQSFILWRNEIRTRFLLAKTRSRTNAQGFICKKMSDGKSEIVF